MRKEIHKQTRSLFLRQYFFYLATISQQALA